MLTKIFILTVVVFSVMSCSSKSTDMDKIVEAQECLDAYARTGEGTLDDCEAKVEGLETASAYGIRCATGYLREGFTTQNFIDAIDTLSSVNAGNIETFLGLMTFNNAGTATAADVAENYQQAQLVYGYCATSMRKVATMLSTFSYLVNALHNYVCTVNGAGSCDVSDTKIGRAHV